MNSGRQFACSAFFYLAAAAIVSAQTRSMAPTSEDIVVQMTQAQADNRAHSRPYIVTRNYKLFDHEGHIDFKSQVIAAITVEPPDSKTYVIQSTLGSGWGEKVVRKMLDGEVAFARNYGSTDITRRNYDFLLVREEELSAQHSYVLELLPKRKSKDLLHGTIWVDANTFLIRRVEGEPPQSLSWWLRDVRVVLLYGYVGPMWLQTSSEATANVRVLGRSTVVWQDVSYQMGEPIPGASLVQTTISIGEMATE